MKRTPKGSKKNGKKVSTKDEGYSLDEMTFGDKSVIQPGDLDPKKAKVKVTLWVDGDLVLECRKRAGGRGYQSLMNKAIREGLKSVDVRDDLMARIERIEQRLEASSDVKGIN